MKWAIGLTVALGAVWLHRQARMLDALHSDVLDLHAETEARWRATRLLLDVEHSPQPSRPELRVIAGGAS